MLKIHPFTDAKYRLAINPFYAYTLHEFVLLGHMTRWLKKNPIVIYGCESKTVCVGVGVGVRVRDVMLIRYRRKLNSQFKGKSSSHLD